MNGRVWCLYALPLVALLGQPALSSILFPTPEEEAFLEWLRDPASTQLLQEALTAAPPPLSALRTPTALCVQDLQYALLTGNDTWQMRDSFDKALVPTGILAGAFTHLGNWEECVGVRDVFSSLSNRTFHGQMCVVTIRPKVPGVRRNVAFPPLTDDQRLMLAAVALRMAYCVPSTCTAEQIRGIFNIYLGQATNKVSVNLQDIDCTTADKRPLDGHDWVGISVLIVLGVVVVASTAYDIIVPPTRKKPLPASFSVISNGRKMLAAPRAGGDQTLSSLHGIRFLSMIWVVVGHRYAFSMATPYTNLKFILDVSSNWYYIGLTNATVSVDTFFVLSGLLVSYLFFRQEPSKRHLNIPMYYIHRYIRLTPALAMMVLVDATFLSRVGNGPLWPAMTSEERENCQKNWWNVLLYISNYVDPYKMCVGQSWYLMVDMQLHWISPLLLIPIAKWPRLGKLFFLPFIVVGLIISFVISYVKELPVGGMDANDEEKATYVMSHYYIQTYARFVPYIIGMAVGFILAEEKEEKERKPLTRVTGFIGWFSVTALMLIPLFIMLPFMKEPFPSYLEAAFFNSLHRPAWGLGVAGVVYLCANGLGGPVNKLLSWPGFQILGRFSYCIYLVHIAVQTVQIGGLMTYVHLSDREILMQFSADFVTSLLLAAILSLICESPFLVLEKQLLGGHRAPKSTAPTVEPPPSQHSKPPLKTPERLVL